ncbi:hypothetical protein INR49_032568 [Caranx melampygus]|nr:hypothetical protein INR49_032568 [Caranx melampygus]
MESLAETRRPEGNPEMTSNEDRSTDGNLLHHSTRNKGSMSTVRTRPRNFPLYLLVVVSLGLLNAILLLTAIVIGIYCGEVGGDSTPQHVQAEPLFVEYNQLQLIVNEATTAQRKAEQALQQEVRRKQRLNLQLDQNKTLTDNLARQIEALQVEKATLESTLSDMLESCGRCPPGWFLLNTSCYYHAKYPSHPSKNWGDSKADCISRGAHLAVIDTWEEQREGTWMWVNNVALNEGYWMDSEPNNDQRGLEDCAALRMRDSPRRSWFAGNCFLNKEWLCEKNSSSRS